MNDKKRVQSNRNGWFRTMLLAAMAASSLLGTTGCTQQQMQQIAPAMQQLIPLLTGLLQARQNGSTTGIQPPATTFQPQSPGLTNAGVVGPNGNQTCRDASCAQTALAGSRDQVQVNLRDGAPTRRDPVAGAQNQQAVARAEEALRRAQAQLAEARQQRPFSGSRVSQAQAAVERAEADLASARGTTPPS